VESGECVYDSSLRCITWHIPEINADETGSIEFSVPEVSPDSFFPVNVTFSSEALFAGIHVSSVSSGSGELVEDYELDSMVVVEKFEMA